MFVLRLAETAAGLQWYEVPLIILLGVLGGIIMIIGGIVFLLARVGVGLSVMGIGFLFISAAISWASPDNAQSWLIYISVYAVISGVVIEVLDDTGVINVDLYDIYFLSKKVRYARRWHVR